MNLTDNFESDERLPSGEWSGFYIESHQPQKGWMHLYLNFANGKIVGEGTDYVGPWNISGTYDVQQGTCSWTKQYMGKHQVNYTGQISDQGIAGEWDIRGWLNGPFHIWPRSRYDLQRLYMQEELRQPPSTMPLGTVPVEDPLVSGSSFSET